MKDWLRARFLSLDAELQAAHGEQFLQIVYRRHLGRPLDAVGRDHYLPLLQQKRGRQRVLADIQRSPEARRYALSHGKEGMRPRLYSPLLPKELQQASLPRPRVALLGTCVAEGLLQIAHGEGWTMDHYLMDSGSPTPFEAIRSAPYDLILVNLTLRTVLGGAVPSGDGDLFHLRPELEAGKLENAALRNLQCVIENLLANRPEGIPVFFLAFLEPPAWNRGAYGRNRKQGSLYHLVRSLNDHLEEIASSHPNTYFLEINDIRQYYGDAESYDGYFSHYTHGGLLSTTPQGEWLCRDLLDRLQGAYASLQGLHPIKLIITDLDNTLWRGVLAEEEEIIPWHHTEGWPLGYAEALLECKRRGLILAIASKNDPEATQERFAQVWGAKLRWEDFAITRINWDPKPQNIAEILERTNILPEHTLFIDDNPLEIEEVRAHFPQMRFLTGAPERWRHVLLYAPETQPPHQTEESTQRTELIRAKIAREESQALYHREEWLQSLELTLRVERIPDSAHKDYARALELLNKTNQFNTTGRRWSEGELQDWLRSGGRLITAHASDRFAKQGLIALALVQDAEIIQVVLSCRVFGLGIEQALLHGILSKLWKDGFEEYQARWRDTGRNHACRDLWELIGAQWDKDAQLWRGRTPPPLPAWIRLQNEL